MKYLFTFFMLFAMVLLGCEGLTMELGPNQFEGIEDRKVVIIDDTGYVSGSVVVNFHMDSTITNTAYFSSINVYYNSATIPAQKLAPSSRVMAHLHVTSGSTMTYHFELFKEPNVASLRTSVTYTAP